MSRVLAQIEALSPLRFILLIGAVGGALQSIPVFFHSGTLNVANARVSLIFVALVVSPLWWSGAALLWWFAVRRRRFSIWWMACQVTLGLAAADVLLSALAVVAASIETKGEFVPAFGQQLAMAVLSPLELTAFRSVVWFVQALVLVALGRLLLRMDTLVPPLPWTATDPAAVP
ncbi:MAG: hypothetical protein JWM41_1727 [Gemmatimonadetes bacterium]|nr:hypothetical protein [Gemmatimonadota bacterium]